MTYQIHNDACRGIVMQRSVKEGYSKILRQLAVGGLLLK